VEPQHDQQAGVRALEENAAAIRSLCVASLADLAGTYLLNLAQVPHSMSTSVMNAILTITCCD